MYNYNVQDVLKAVETVNVISGAIIEDGLDSKKDLNKWIDKYYSQLVQLRSVKCINNNNMIVLLNYTRLSDKAYVDVYGVLADDYTNKKNNTYSLLWANLKEYAGLFVPKSLAKYYTLDRIAAELLCEYGWHDYNKKIICPRDIRLSIQRTVKEGKNRLGAKKSVSQEKINKCIEEVLNKLSKT
jgi:hypothetical protein